MTRYCGTSGSPAVRNCGTTASMKAVPFGLTALSSQASKTMRRRGIGGADGSPVGSASGGARHWRMPR